MRPRVWLVREIHCHLPDPNLESLWISGRPLSPEKSLAEDIARKVLGPLTRAEVTHAVNVLRAELEAAGVDVSEEFAPDD